MPRHLPYAGQRSVRAFTLIELMITIAVAAVLISLATPSFRYLMVTNALTTASNDIVSALNVAKMEAIKRNAKTQFCSNDATTNTADTLGTACGTKSAAVNVLTSGTTSVAILDASTAIQGSVRLSGNIQALRFGGPGLGYAPAGTSPYSGTVAIVCSSAISTQNRRVISVATGGSVISTSITTGTCP